MTRRKSPIKHRVKKHTRGGHEVKSHERGSGKTVPRASKKLKIRQRRRQYDFPRTSNITDLAVLAKVYNHSYPYHEMGYGILGHPYLSTVYMDEGKLIRVTKKNYDEVLKKIDEHIDKITTVYGIFLSMKTPYQMQFLMFAKSYLSEEDYNEMLKDVWMMTERPEQHRRRDLVDLFKISDKKLLMSADELKKFNELPENIKVYRGVSSRKPLKWLSWTLDEDKAEWFARRFGKGGKLVEASIPKQHAFAYFSGRGEEEIVLNPARLRKVKTRVV